MTQNTDILNNKNHLLTKGRMLLFFLLLLCYPACAGKKTHLVILHTNDTHSQVEPTEKSDLKTSDMGGYARRMGIIQRIRHEEKNVLLLDAGDFSQGSPYFNFFNGRIEIDAMNRMQYDAATLGNHEFDNGVDTLTAVLRSARFPILSSNYKMDGTALRKTTKPYLILHRFGLRIGLMALNVNPEGLIIENNYKGIIYQDPMKKALEISTLLKEKKKCDLVICLSHLGADSTKNSVTDFQIVRKSRYIDVIIGGHSHSLITNTTENNALGKPVIIAQMAKSGWFLGRIDLQLEQEKK